MIFLKSAFGAAVVLIATAPTVSAQQRCPPNARAEAVPIPGNLATARCFCDRGFTPVNGRCVRVRSRTGAPPDDPSRMLVAPVQPR